MAVVTNGLPHTFTAVLITAGLQGPVAKHLSSAPVGGHPALPCPSLLSLPTTSAHNVAQRRQSTSTADKPQPGSAVWGAASAFLSRPSSLAWIQPIIRQSLQGRRILPAQTTSCERLRQLSFQMWHVSLGKVAGGSRLAWLGSSFPASGSHKHCLPFFCGCPGFHLQASSPSLRAGHEKGRGRLRTHGEEVASFTLQAMGSQPNPTVYKQLMWRPQKATVIWPGPSSTELTLSKYLLKELSG